MKEEISDMAREIRSKIAKYEEEIKAHTLVGNPDMARAIQKEVDNLKKEALRY